LGYLDIVVITWDKSKDIERIEYFDFVDRDKRDDQDVVQFCFKVVFQKLTSRGIKELELWTDTCSAQFRCRQSLHAILQDVRKDLQLTRIRWNFFVPYHGKSLANGHFGVVKRMLNKEAWRLGASKTESGLGKEGVISFLEGRVAKEKTSVERVPQEIPRVVNVKSIPKTKKYLSFESSSSLDMLVACRKFTCDESPEYTHVWTYPRPNEPEEDADTDELDGNSGLMDNVFGTASADFREILGLLGGVATFLEDAFVGTISSAISGPTPGPSQPLGSNSLGKRKKSN